MEREREVREYSRQRCQHANDLCFNSYFVSPFLSHRIPTGLDPRHQPENPPPSLRHRLVPRLYLQTRKRRKIQTADLAGALSDRDGGAWGGAVHRAGVDEMGKSDSIECGVCAGGGEYTDRGVQVKGVVRGWSGVGEDVRLMRLVRRVVLR